MKNFFIFVVVVFTLFAIFSGLALYNASKGRLEACIYSLQECVYMGRDKKSGKSLYNTFVCCNKSFLCNAKTLYQIYFDEEGLDKDYNEFMQERLKEEMLRHKEYENVIENTAETKIKKDDTNIK